MIVHATDGQAVARKLKDIMSRMLLVTLTEPVVILMGSALAAGGIERTSRKHNAAGGNQIRSD